MKQNVGGFDRIARLVLGVVLVGVGIAGYVDLLALGVLGISALAIEVAVVLIGLVLLVTGAVRTCPIYAALGMDSLREDASTGDATEERPVSERPGTN